MTRAEDFRRRLEERMGSLRTGGTECATGQNAANEIAAFLTPTVEEVVQWFEAVSSSMHVRQNEGYLAAAQATQFKCDVGDDVINAYASRAGCGQRSYEVRFLGGALRFCRLASLAVAADMCGRPGTASRFAQSVDFNGGHMSAKQALEELTGCGLDEVFRIPGVKQKAQAVCAGMIIGILAHEMGHVCLGHALGPNYYETNQEIGRNHEREADSFASSVTAASPFGEYVFEGTLFWYYALAMQETDMKVATTHPLARERLENLIRANPSKASSLGIRLPN